MDPENPAAIQSPRAEDRRRSKRFPLLVPISIKWIGLDSLPAEAEGRAVEGSNHGGLLEIPEQLPFGTEAALTNLLSRKTIMVQVLSLRTTAAGVVRGLAVQFLSPDKQFWGALGSEGQAGAETKAGVPNNGPPSLAARWKSLLHILLGRPRM